MPFSTRFALRELVLSLRLLCWSRRDLYVPLFHLPRRIFLLAFGLLMGGAHPGGASLISEDPDLGTWGVDGTVFAVLRSGKTVYIGGSFSNLVSPNGQTKLSARGLAALDVNTGQPTSWRHDTDGTVLALAVSPDG